MQGLGPTNDILHLGSWGLGIHIVLGSPDDSGVF